MNCELRLLSSLEKVFFDKFTDLPEFTTATMMKNEIFSFQLATRVEETDSPKVLRYKCRLQIESELAPYIQVKRIDYVPSILPLIEARADEDYLVRTPGVMFPDPLQTIKNGEIEVFLHQARAFWLIVEPKEEMVGTFRLHLRYMGRKMSCLEKNVSPSRLWMRLFRNLTSVTPAGSMEIVWRHFTMWKFSVMSTTM